MHLSACDVSENNFKSHVNQQLKSQSRSDGQTSFINYRKDAFAIAIEKMSAKSRNAQMQLSHTDVECSGHEGTATDHQPTTSKVSKVYCAQLVQ